MFVKTLSGIQMPKLIYGTAWKKDRTTDLVVQAVKAGFKGIDTACQPKHYSEAGVGAALNKLADQGFPREKLFVQTKFTGISGQDPKSIPYDKDAPLKTQIEQSLEVSLKNLGTSYVDSLVLHGPMRTEERTLEAWKVLEGFINEGKVKQIGMSNCYSLPYFKKIYDNATVKPSVLQNRFYAESGYDKKLRQFCKEKGIFYQAFWILTANQHILGSTAVQKMAGKYDKTPAQCFYAFLMQTGVITPLTGTTSALHMKEDLDAVNVELNEDEMRQFSKFVDG